MRKQTLIIYSIVFALCVGFAVWMPVPPVQALYGINPTRIQERIDNKASRAAQLATTELARIIKSADEMIANRLQSLQNLLVRLQGDKRLSSDERTNLTTDVNTAISNLNTLKAKIDADTDVTTARADRKSIVTGYRVYVIFEPKERLLVTIDNLQTASGNVSSLSAQVQTLLNNLKSQGKDITAAQNDLTDINTQLSTINTTLTTDKSLLSSVNVNTANPQSIFTQIRKDLAGVRSDFATIRHDFAQLRAALHPLFLANPTGSASNSAH